MITGFVVVGSFVLYVRMTITMIQLLLLVVDDGFAASIVSSSCDQFQQ